MDQPAAALSDSPFHTRVYGDVTCIESDCFDVAASLNTPAHMMFLDLPYGITLNSWDQSVLCQKKIWAMADGVCIKKGAKIFTCQQPFTTYLVSSAPSRLRYDLVWQKNRYAGFANAKKAPLRSHETILVFDGQYCFNPQKTYVGPKGAIAVTAGKSVAGRNTGLKSRDHTLSEYRNPLSILNVKRDDKRDGSGHPTQKPVALLEWLIKTYTNPGDLVLDPTAGSGTTGVAAINLGRRAILIEKDPAYFEVMCKRIAEHQAAKANP